MPAWLSGGESVKNNLHRHCPSAKTGFPMKCLAIDLSSPVASMALTTGEQTIKEFIFGTNVSHGKMLFSHLESLRPEFSSIDFWAVNLGPGSFAGIRASIAAVQGLNFSLQKPVYGINAHEAISQETFMTPSGDQGTLDHLCILSDARRGEVYATVYDSHESGWQLSEDTHITKVSALPTRFTADAKVFFTGPDIENFQKEISTAFGSRAQIATEALYPKAPRLAQIARAMHEGKIPAVHRLDPIYLRPISFVKVTDNPLVPLTHPHTD